MTDDPHTRPGRGLRSGGVAVSCVYIVEERVKRLGRSYWVVSEFSGAYRARADAHREAKQILWGFGEAWGLTVHAGGVSELYGKKQRDEPIVRIRRLGINP